jgi:hypothetical protein
MRDTENKSIATQYFLGNGCCWLLCFVSNEVVATTMSGMAETESKDFMNDRTRKSPLPSGEIDQQPVRTQLSH